VNDYLGHIKSQASLCYRKIYTVLMQARSNLHWTVRLAGGNPQSKMVRLSEARSNPRVGLVGGNPHSCAAAQEASFKPEGLFYDAFALKHTGPIFGAIFNKPQLLKMHQIGNNGIISGFVMICNFKKIAKV
jgi:hypothetical protein